MVCGKEVQRTEASGFEQAADYKSEKIIWLLDVGYK